MGNGARTCHNVMAVPFAFIMSWCENKKFHVILVG
jgi:hypothetical protein